MPSPLCAAVGEVIREMGAEDVACHCDCQDRTYRFDVQYNFDGTALVRDVACRQGLLHARSLDPGLDPQLYHDMMHRLDVSLRDVTHLHSGREGRGRHGGVPPSDGPDVGRSARGSPSGHRAPFCHILDLGHLRL